MIKQYLKVYNIFFFLSWSAFLIYMVFKGFQMDRYSILLLNISQIGALLEIVHAYKGWVKSPLKTTVIQVMSRIFVLVLINCLPDGAQIEILGINGVQIVSLAWAVTEIVRYSFYYSILIERPSELLMYLRYTLFLVLYPLGVAGEIFIIVSLMGHVGFGINPTNIIMIVIMIAYVIFFPQMYGHMLKQRRKKLNNG